MQLIVTAFSHCSLGGSPHEIQRITYCMLLLLGVEYGQSVMHTVVDCVCSVSF